MRLQDQVIYFDSDGKVGYRFFTAKTRRRLRLLENQRRRYGREKNKK